MRKSTLLILFLLLNWVAYAQCPIDVTITSAPDVTLGPVCKNTSVQLTASPSVGAIGNVTQYVWVSGDDTLQGNAATFSLLANSQHIVVYMQTTSGCNSATPASSDTTSASIQVQTVEMQSTANPLITDCNQTVTDVQVTTTGNGTPSYNYELSGFGTSTDGLFNSVPQGTYNLFTTDSQGCKDTTQVAVVPNTCPDPSPTDKITPNGDGFNDTWQIFNIRFYPDNEVFIFDRWGQRVYHKVGYDNSDGWDAKYIGANLPVSTYYYLLEITPENGGDDIIMRGPISIFR